MGKKDVIKVEGWLLTESEKEKIAVFAPRATISFIESFEVMQKKQVSTPAIIQGIIRCPNSKCITNHEEGNREFRIRKSRKSTVYICAYCEKEFLQDEVTGC